MSYAPRSLSASVQAGSIPSPNHSNDRAAVVTLHVFAPYPEIFIHRRNSSAYHAAGKPGKTKICLKKSYLRESRRRALHLCRFLSTPLILLMLCQLSGDHLSTSPRGISSAQPVASLALPRGISYASPWHLSTKMPFSHLYSDTYVLSLLL